uniref:Uncharacterized protein n=1 Tax=Vespula pensylvanica TaxID=30213 RepID=A0A834PEC7_VESPE|nr:hypothetical protein H0235_000644 [Vespula pensylvanica]
MRRREARRLFENRAQGMESTVRRNRAEAKSGYSPAVIALAPLGHRKKWEMPVMEEKRETNGYVMGSIWGIPLVLDGS